MLKFIPNSTLLRVTAKATTSKPSLLVSHPYKLISIKTYGTVQETNNTSSSSPPPPPPLQLFTSNYHYYQQPPQSTVKQNQLFNEELVINLKGYVNIIFMLPISLIHLILVPINI
ncbi:unnamed protein product [Cunninghamella echinulata]